MNNQKIIKINKFILEKKFDDVILLIENNFNNTEKTSKILNILGASKLKKKNFTNFDLISAIEDFRECYLKEKTTNQGIEGLMNFIVSSLKINKYDDSILYFKEAEAFFGYIPKLFNLMIDVFIKSNDVISAIHCLEKIIKIDGPQNYSLQKYIYLNSYINKWSQKDFLHYTKKLEPVLPRLESAEIINFKKNKKIKLAFLSSDICGNHSVTYFLKALIQNVDRQTFVLVFYSNCKIENEDETTREFKTYFDEWVNISSLNDILAINTIRKNNIDIIIDLMGLSSTNRIALFKNRLAKIQILWLGYNNTSGLKNMDYLIADPNLIHQDEVAHYSEKIIFLPGIWNCHSGFSILRSNNPSPIIKNKYITFGSFNNISKISDEVINVWSKILKNIKNSKLIIKSSINHSDKNLKEKFGKNEVLKQIIFLDKKKSFEDHIKEYNKIDLALDTFPYNGVTTSFEAIWMGVPVLTLKGFNPNSRAGVSINKNLDMKYLIANNEQEYISKAINLSNDYEKIISVRKNLFDKVKNSNLFNHKKFSKEFFEELKKIYFK